MAKQIESIKILLLLYFVSLYLQMKLNKTRVHVKVLPNNYEPNYELTKLLAPKQKFGDTIFS